MTMGNFEVKSYPEMWKSLGMNVERFEKMRCVLGDVYQKTFLAQENRPKNMDYFDITVAEIHGGRIADDVGGQDSKVIALDEAGKVTSFQMNDKCAAGTGRFLEIMTASLGIPLHEFGNEALQGS